MRYVEIHALKIMDLNAAQFDMPGGQESTSFLPKYGSRTESRMIVARQGICQSRCRAPAGIFRRQAICYNPATAGDCPAAWSGGLDHEGRTARLERLRRGLT
jgi:hypothetical protein